MLPTIIQRIMIMLPILNQWAQQNISSSNTGRFSFIENTNRVKKNIAMITQNALKLKQKRDNGRKTPNFFFWFPVAFAKREPVVAKQTPVPVYKAIMIKKWVRGNRKSVRVFVIFVIISSHSTLLCVVATLPLSKKNTLAEKEHRNRKLIKE